MNRWTLAFGDRAYERQFQESWLKATARIDKLWVIGGFSFLAIFTLLLVFFLPENCHDYLWIRYVIMLPLVALAQIPVFFRTRFRRALTPSYFVSSFLVFGTAFFLFVFTHRDHNLVYLFELAAIYLFCQQYSRVMFRHSMVFSLVAGGATITAITVDPSLIGIPHGPAIFAVIGHAMVGIFIAYGREFFVRRNYVSMQVLKEENARNQALAVEAQSASEAKSRFLAIVSHELRTPLNAIIGNADGLRAGIFGPVTAEKMRDAVEDISGNGHQLSKIVKDVLDLSKATAGQIELNETSFSICRVAQEIVRLLAPQAKAAGISVQLIDDPELPKIVADQRLLRRVLVSLLTNALNYTNPGGEVWLYLQPLPDGGVVIEVKDTGVGIAADQVDKAMELFTQIDDSLNRSRSGIGIGLPLTKHLVELHGGTISIESELGRGTRVRVQLPSDRVVGNWTNDAVAGSAA